MVKQMELSLERPRMPDRNARNGGRSFYFFDLDDNVLFLPTPILIFHRKTGIPLAISTQTYAEQQTQIGVRGPFSEYSILGGDEGSFRRFRDALLPKDSPFLQDIKEALRKSESDWRGPSWRFFFHAVHNQRPLSIITARGHHPDVVRSGLGMLVKQRKLTTQPNYLAVYPVSHSETRLGLGDTQQLFSTAELKRRAIINSVERAFEEYGLNQYHRFGMSDDDPKNLELVVEAMRELKQRYPQNSFFVFESKKNEVIRREVLRHDVVRDATNMIEQLPLL